MPSTLYESALVADGALAVFAPDPNTGTVVDRTGNYTATLQNGATVTSDTLVARTPGAISLDGTNDYVSTNFETRRNLCTNPSFETGTTGWTRSTNATENGWTRSAGWYEAGTYSLYVKATGTGAGQFFQNYHKTTGSGTAQVPVSAATPYTASCRINAVSVPSGGGPVIYLEWFDAGGSSTGSASYSTEAPLGESTISVTATSPAGAAFCRIRVTNSSGTGNPIGNGEVLEYYLDAVLFEAASSAGAYFDGSGYVNASGAWVPATDVFRTDLGDTAWTGTAHASTSTRAGRTNLITNPSFEVDTAGWTLTTTNWTSVTAARVSDTFAGKVGGYGLRLAGTKDNSGTTRYLVANTASIAVTAGTTYTASGYVAVVDAPTGAGFGFQVYVNWYTAADVYLTTSAPTAVTASGRISITAAAPATAAKAVIHLQVASATALDTVDGYFDGILFEASSSVNPYFDGSGSVEHQGLSGWLGLEHASASDCGVFANGTTRTFVIASKRDTDATYQGLICGDAPAGTNYPRLYWGPSPNGNRLFWETLNGDPAPLQDLSITPTAASLTAVEINEAADFYKAWGNGVYKEADALTAQYAAGNTLRIGDLKNAYYFDGLIGPVAILPKALTSAEHAAYATLFLSGAPRPLLVREPAPKYQVSVITPDGYRTRWADDEPDAERVPNGLSWSTSMPGGADTLTCTLPREPERSYPDLSLLSEIQVSRDGGRTLRYRLDEVPKVSGDQIAVEPAARGYRAALEDRGDVTALFVDRDLSHWGPPTLQRQIDAQTAGPPRYHLGQGQQGMLADDGTGNPCLYTGFDRLANDPNDRALSELWYMQKELIGSIYVNDYLDRYSSGTGLTAPWASYLTLSSDDRQTSTYASSNRGATSGGFTLTNNSGVLMRYAYIQLYLPDTYTGDGEWRAYFKRPAVFGQHGLTPSGSYGGGFYTGQMLEWLVNSEVEGLPVGTVENGTFLHTHAAFFDPTTAVQIVEALARMEGNYDWFVYDDFQFRQRGTYGKRWRARVADAGLKSVGASTSRLFNQMAVRTTDPQYGQLTVGPTGTGYEYESDDLRDDDPEHPANLAGVTRRGLLDIGEGTYDSAATVGRIYLEQMRLLDNAGQAELVGYVEDDAGIMHPVDAVLAGDEISFTDSADPSWRRVSQTTFNADRRANTISLDSPAPTMDALLARLQAVLLPLN